MCCPPNNQYPESNKDLEEPKEPKIIEGKLMGVQSTANGDYYVILANGINETQKVGLSSTLFLEPNNTFRFVFGEKETVSFDPMVFYLAHKGKTLFKIPCDHCGNYFWILYNEQYDIKYRKEKYYCNSINCSGFVRGYADGERGYFSQEEDGGYFDGYREGYRKFMLGCLRGNKKRPEIIRYSD